MMKLLFIGNSFSVDAIKYIEVIAGEEIFARTLYIGGCSLKMHAENLKTGEAAYEYRNPDKLIEMSSIVDALDKEDWDIVSVQQVSGQSGRIECYEPYINEVLDVVKERVPKAKIVFHKTWAYDPDSQHEAFAFYNNDTEYMYKKICETVSEICAKYSLPVIPSGDTVQAVRALPEFKGEDGLNRITRDGFHLSLDYGRYAAALTLYRFLTGKSAATALGVPEGVDMKIIEKIYAIVDSVI